MVSGIAVSLVLLEGEIAEGQSVGREQQQTKWLALLNISVPLDSRQAVPE